MGGRAPVPTPSPSRAAAPSPSSDKPCLPPLQQPRLFRSQPLVLPQLHPQVEQEMSSIIVARALGTCSVTVLASSFWWSKMMVRIPPLVILMKIHLLCLLLSNEGTPEEHIDAGAAKHYESLIVQRVLSAQMEKTKQNQRHMLFQTMCVIKEHSCRMIIDGGSCNNLASSDMVEKLALSTKPHPHLYHIQWLNSSGKAKVTRLVRINFAIGSYHDVV
jgi:hypothetical protein